MRRTWESLEKENSHRPFFYFSHKPQTLVVNPKTPAATNPSKDCGSMEITKRSRCSLEEDHIVEILSRLPVKSLMRFSCVSKEWYSLTRNSHVINMHLRRSDSSNLSLLTYTTDRVGGFLDVPIYGISMPGNEATDLVSIDLSFLKDCTCFESVQVVGSSNGLVCLVTGIDKNEAKDMDGVEIIIWNPATRQCRIIPKPILAENINYRPATSTFGFGFSDNHNTNNYKIVGIFHGHVQVFTRSTNCWRLVEGEVFPSNKDYFRADSICLNGVLYWMPVAISDRSLERLVLSFNLCDEALDVIQLPSTDDGVLNRRLLSWKNSLACTCAVAVGINEIQGWAKITDDSEESTGTWTNPFSIDSSILSEYGRIIGIWKDQVLIQSVTINGFGLFLYDPKTKKRGKCLPKPEAVKGYYNAKLVNYVESLVLV